jgi:hypothetical protein
MIEGDLYLSECLDSAYQGGREGGLGIVVSVLIE